RRSLMDAIITAGGIPKPDDPLYQYTQGKNKALLDLGGKPMIQWVLDAVSNSALVDHIVIVGLDQDPDLKSTKTLHFLPNQGGIVDNIKAGTYKVAEINPDAELLLVASSDIPTVTTEMVDWTIQQAEELRVDIMYTVVEQQTMENRFPNANRSFIKLKASAVCGGDMHAISVTAVTHNEEMWNKLEASRKNAFKQMAILGFDTLFLVGLRLIDINTAARRIAKRLGLAGVGEISPYAEIAMDVDKPHQLELLRKDLTN
ncbi:MAG: nucleotidyltransferase family protein, partial [Chloroflexota bacterium]